MVEEYEMAMLHQMVDKRHRIRGYIIPLSISAFGAVRAGILLVVGLAAPCPHLAVSAADP